MVLQQREEEHEFLVVFSSSQFIIRAHFIIIGAFIIPWAA